MKRIRFSLTCFICLFFCIDGAISQNYVRLEDASGYTPTTAQIAELELVADSLCAAFDSAGFQGQFKVYDFGFYLHQEVTDGGYPEPFEQKIEEVAALSPYYLLFGKQTDRSGVYTRFWVDVRLPDSLCFTCLDMTGRSSLKVSMDLGANIEHVTNGLSPSDFHLSEIVTMNKLSDVVAELDECCYYNRGSNLCTSQCFLNEEEIGFYFESNGFEKIPISINGVAARNSFTKKSLKTHTNGPESLSGQFEDFSDLDVTIDEESFDLDSCMLGIMESNTTLGNIKVVLTDNVSFCEVDNNNYIEEMNSGSYVFYFWAHVWASKEDVGQGFLFIKIVIQGSGSLIPTPFTGHIPVETGLNHDLNLTYVQNTILSIYNKNNLQIAVDLADKDPLVLEDLYNMIMSDPPGNSISLGHSKVYLSAPQEPGITYKPLSFLRYETMQIPSNLEYFQSNTHKSYAAGWALAHEFLHQIINKSYYYIKEDRHIKQGYHSGHVISSKNLLYPGDGLATHGDFRSPEDLGCAYTKSCEARLIFSGRYVPTADNPNELNEWEEIILNQKKLIILFIGLRNTGLQHGKSSQQFKIAQLSFSKTVDTLEYFE